MLRENNPTNHAIWVDNVSCWVRRAAAVRRWTALLFVIILFAFMMVQLLSATAPADIKVVGKDMLDSFATCQWAQVAVFASGILLSPSATRKSRRLTLLYLISCMSILLVDGFGGLILTAVAGRAVCTSHPDEAYWIILVTFVTGSAFAIMADRAWSRLQLLPQEKGTNTWGRTAVSGVLFSVMRGTIVVIVFLSLAVPAAALLSMIELSMVVLVRIVFRASLDPIDIIFSQDSEMDYDKLIAEGAYGAIALAAIGTLTKVACYVGFAMICTRALRLARRVSRRSASSLLVNQGSRPIVLLRSFQDDEARISGGRLSSDLLRIRFRLEEILAEAILAWGPFIAVGQPNDKLSPLGAYRDYPTGETWRELVSKWIGQANLIVVVAGMTPSFRWELEQLVSADKIDRAVFLFPPSRQDNFTQRLAFLAQALGRSLGSVPTLERRGDILALKLTNSGAIWVAGNARQATDYQLALEVLAPATSIHKL